MQDLDHDLENDPSELDLWSLEVSRRKVVAALLHRDRRFAQQAVPLAHAEQLASDFEALGYSVMNSQGFTPQYRQLIVWVSVGRDVPMLSDGVEEEAADAESKPESNEATTD